MPLFAININTDAIKLILPIMIIETRSLTPGMEVIIPPTINIPGIVN
jgi:hypothetical protein